MAENDEFKPRNYQVELMKIAINNNTIIYLPTGAGKTYIAVLVLKQLSAPLTIPWNSNGKVTVLLVNTVALVHQHAQYIARHTPFMVGEYTGDLNIDFWDEHVWNEQCKRHQVLIMTCQILTNAVERQVLDLNRINLLIFDECHRGVNDQPMRQLMKYFQHITHKPRVLGLTATLLNGNCKPAKVQQLVQDLEVTYHSKVATVDELKDVLGYSTNPRERLIYYTVYHPSSVEQQAIRCLRNTIDVLRLIRTESRESPTLENVVPLEPDKGQTELANLLADTIIHIEMLGTYGGIQAIISHTIQIECMRKYCNDTNLYNILNAMTSALTHAKCLLSGQLTGNKVEDIYNFSSEKVKQLFNELKQYKKNSQEELCGIIFVQRRFTAKVLFLLLKMLAETVKEFSFIKPNFIVGYNANPYNDTRESLYLTKVNKEIIQMFSSKECNLLVSSNVLEEGIDVPTCTLVVKFDRPLDYRSYIQSKGRARHKESIYCIMVEQEDLEKYNVKYSTFQTIEAKLNHYLIGQNDIREGPQENDIRDLYNEDVIPPYYVDGPGSAQVNMVSAVSLLSAYCNSFEADAYTTYAPNWYIEVKKDVRRPAMRVVIELPTVCPYIEPILGPFMANKKQAKRGASLRACEILHKIGELDNNLRPAKRTELTEETEFLFQHWPKTKEKFAGNKKTSRLHRKHMAECCIGQLLPMCPIYLHIINFRPIFNTASDITLEIMRELYSKNLCFGIISPKEFPKLCKFPLYVSSGEIEVDILTNVETVYLTEIELDKIRRFNHLIYNDILGMLKKFLIVNNEDTVLTVPVDKENKRIDFDVMDQNKSLKERTREPTREERLSLDVSETEFLGRIVTPWYRKDDTEYLVTNICYDMDAYTQFPGNYKDYMTYYKTLYQCTILNGSRPLIKVKAVSQRTNCFKPRGQGGKKNKEAFLNYIIHLVPELVVVQDFPACLWLQSKLLPSVFDKVYQFLRVENLRKNIADGTGIGIRIERDWQPLRLDKHLIYYEIECNREEDEVLTDENVEVFKTENIVPLTNMLNKEVISNTLQEEYPWEKSEEPVDIERNIHVTLMDIQYYVNFINNPVKPIERQLRNSPERRKPAITYNVDFVEKRIKMLDTTISEQGPELADIYKALATAKCNDIVNLERLETLGDSFLKFIVSLFIILKYPKYDEGKSTTLKGRIVSNKNLYYVANYRNLGASLKFLELKADEDWCPPGFCLPPVLQNRSVVMSALLNMAIPVNEQVNGFLSEDTIAAINSEIAKNTLNEDNCNSKSIDYYLGDHYVPDKFIADAAESILGVYLESCGITGAIRVLEWLEVVPKSVGLTDLLKQPLPNPVLNPNSTQENIDFYLPSYKELEENLGYTFRNRAYLLQALTHSSYTPNRVTKCYQRLEFLGDAVLDFLITMYIYENCGNLTPGDLTDLRSAIVNNITFACFAVRCGFHKHLLAINNKLQSYIDKFIKYQENKNFSVNDDVLILLNEDDFHLAEYVDVPKVLGDIFESLAGAVFLDSGMDLNVVWKVFYRIMWKEIDTFRNNVPKNAIRVLYETVGAHPEFHNAVIIEDGRAMVKLDFMINGTKKRVHGFGDNKTVAKRAAAKIALRLLGR